MLSVGIGVLPMDILNIIIDELDLAALKTLRLVSKAMNSISEPRAFRSTTISFTKKRGPFAEAQLSTFASPILAAQLSRSCTVEGCLPESSSSESQIRPTEVACVNSRWTRSLTIQQLVPTVANDALSPYDAFQGAERDAMLSCQGAYLSAAIQSLTSVTEVILSLSRRGPYFTVLHALSHLPSIRSATIMLECGNYGGATSFLQPDPSFVGEILPLDQSFRSLRRLEVHGFSLSPHICEALERTIAANPRIEEISLHPATWCQTPAFEPESAQKLESLFSHRVGGSGSQKDKPSTSIKELVLGGDRFTISAALVPVLGSRLVHLDIQSVRLHTSDLTRADMDAFWTCLRDEGVQLEKLAVYPTTRALTTYLSSYTGLRTLRLSAEWEDDEEVGVIRLPDSSTSDESDQDDSSLSSLDEDDSGYTSQPPNPEYHLIAHDIFHSILPLHRRTLQDFSLGFLRYDVWSITAEYLDEVLKLEGLKTLELIVHYPESDNEFAQHFHDPRRSDDPFIELASLLRYLGRSHLKDLFELKLRPTRAYPANLVRGRCGNGFVRYISRMEASFMKDLCKVKILDAFNDPQSTSQSGSQVLPIRPSFDIVLGKRFGGLGEAAKRLKYYSGLDSFCVKA
ncbi:hypothetical protein DFP72DRAFT_884125 [Ephemerocybe angulata]|uniref:F-box domain-containing protein n=1 Tax=Ephemerocybe angulata TaxID=980116 RepID=A0A8H6MD84_9AGAR|nr:hypothetical protein DFP72DRAFT_884125 [Tulosesus angulatus]